MTATFPRTMGYGLGGSFQRGTSAFGPWLAEPDYPLKDQTMTSAPTFPPFKFEPRRARIDWRLLHGIDINSMVRDVDLDTLEKIVNIVAFGDIEAEDTRHLTELNFIKIFRLSQMMIEYLLYVQDCLQSSNAWLQQDRSNMDKYVQAARLRIRELEANLKMNKRELRRTRKTIKTYELLAVLNDGKGKAATMPAPTTLFTTTVAPSSPPPQQQTQTQAAKAEPNPVNIAMEALLRKDLAVLGERLSKATLECQTLRSERDDLFQAVKDLEAVVKSRPHYSESSSPQGSARQNAEAMQTIQGLQDQLNKATVEITKLRNEKEDLSVELERANTDKRQLQDEKGRLLSEIASRPAEALKGASDSPRANDNLGGMLLDAERQKAALQDQLEDARAEITALQKQLMKAMKATAFGPTGAMPQPPPDDRMVREMEGAMRELEVARSQLEKELTDMRRMYNDDVRQLQEELEATQARAAAADRRLTETRPSGPGPTRQGAARMDSQSAGGFVKVTEERRTPHQEEEDADRQKSLLAEYEAMNERLNQQLLQLKNERNMLAGEVEQLRSQLQGRSPRQAGDPGIGRDWRTEEIERLKVECDSQHRRILDLEDALRDRDTLVERLRNTIRELQARLDERNRQLAEAGPGVSRVKQQVQHFERMAGPPQHAKTQSFSFVAEESAPQSSLAAEARTSMRRSSIAEPPPRSPSPAALSSHGMEEPELPSPAYAPPSPKRPEQLLDPSLSSKWLRRVPRPSAGDATGIQQRVLRRVAGLKPEALEMMLQEEIRVITENPYPYEGDEEEIFKSLMPHEIEDRPGVRAVKPHTLQDLEGARSLLTGQLLAVVDDELSQFGIDLTTETLTDKAYVACMQELAERRSQALRQYPREVQERAESLREYLLTHLELAKRAHQRQQAIAQQQRLQEEQQRLLAAASAEGRTVEIRHSGGEGRSSAAGPTRQGSASGSAGASTTAAAAPASQSFSAVAATAKNPFSPSSATPGSPAGGTPPQVQLPAFPARQASLQRSSAGGSDAGASTMQSMLPPTPSAFRPASETLPVMPAQQSATGQGLRVSSASTRASPVGSTKEDINSQPSMSGEHTHVADLRLSGGSSGEQAAPARQQPLSRSGASNVQQPTPVTGSTPQQPSPHQLSREASQSGSPVVLGHAKPVQIRPASQQAAAASVPGGNMNMSIRSVKYQESDFDDDDDDVVALPQPKPVQRAAADDEYALTEDEETQQDMGIEDSDDFSPVGRQPKMLMRPTSSPRTTGPSRLGAQASPAVAQSKGWATDEPLQAAPPKPTASHQQSETAEMEELESIHSFDNNSLSQSLRRPGAWGSPSTSLAKPIQRARDRSQQLSATSKQSGGWNETIKSFGATSGQGDEIQSIQEISGLDSFADSIRPAGRFAQQRKPVGASQASAAPPARTAAPRHSYSSELSDIEYA